MWSKLLCLTLLLFVALPALAQTDTPTPTITPTSTPFGSVPEAEVYNVAATAAARTNELPDDIARPVGNQAIVPAVDLRPLFAYVKWLFSANSAQELLGTTLAPFATDVFVLFIGTIILVTVYMSLYVISFLLKVFFWFVSWIMKLIDLIPFV